MSDPKKSDVLQITLRIPLDGISEWELKKDLSGHFHVPAELYINFKKEKCNERRAGRNQTVFDNFGEVRSVQDEKDQKS